MTLLVIPLQPVPSQTLTALLNQQQTQIVLRQMGDAMFLDLYVDNALIVGGVVCENRNNLVRNSYLGFDGDLIFTDTQAGTDGGSDPVYTGLGSQFVLLYLSPGAP